MPPTPVDDHTTEFEELAALDALGVLEGDELLRFEAHAAHCEYCRLMVQGDREALAHAAPEMDPSPDFKERLMQRAASELAASEPAARAQAAAQPSRIVAFRRRTAWLTSIAAVLVVGLLTLGAFTFQNQTVAMYPLSSTSGLNGSAVVNVRRSGATELQMSGVPEPPAGYLYEAWIIPPGGQPVPAGTAPSGDAKLPLGQLSSGTKVAVTQERSRVDAPTSPPVLSGVVQS